MLRLGEIVDFNYLGVVTDSFQIECFKMYLRDSTSFGESLYRSHRIFCLNFELYSLSSRRYRG